MDFAKTKVSSSQQCYLYVYLHLFAINRTCALSYYPLNNLKFFSCVKTVSCSETIKEDLYVSLFAPFSIMHLFVHLLLAFWYYFQNSLQICPKQLYIYQTFIQETGTLELNESFLLYMLPLISHCFLQLCNYKSLRVWMTQTYE